MADVERIRDALRPPGDRLVAVKAEASMALKRLEERAAAIVELQDEVNAGTRVSRALHERLKVLEEPPSKDWGTWKRRALIAEARVKELEAGL